MSLPRLIAYLVVVGGLSGLFAWLLILAGHFVFGMSRPTWMALLLAIPRGSLFGVVLGLALRWYWSRRMKGTSPGREP
jgi:hypothetical protein